MKKSTIQETDDRRYYCQIFWQDIIEFETFFSIKKACHAPLRFSWTWHFCANL